MLKTGGKVSTTNDPTIISDEIIVVYDMDDVLWGYTEVAARHAGINFEHWTDFHVEEIMELSEAERKAVRAVIGRSDYYEEIEFYPGVEEIFRPCSLSERVRVQINSNVVSEEAREIKIRRLRQVLPNLADDDVVFGLVQCGKPKSTLKKRIDPRTYIFIDDSPYNIAGSPAKINLMPTRPWNTSKSAKRVLANSQPTFAPDLKSINQLVYDLVQQQLALSS